jgi:hypothetical protein
MATYTTYEAQQRHWAAIGFTPPTGPDRCEKCAWHVPTAGHVGGCPNAKESR